MKQLLLSLLLLAVVSAALSSNVCAQEPGAARSRGTVKAEDIRRAIEASKPGDTLDYSGRTIEGNLNLYELPETDGPTGKERVVWASLNFRDAVFEDFIGSWDSRPGAKDLRGQPRVRFASEVNFNGAQFKDSVSLDAAIFQEKASFGSHFFAIASFTEAIFEKTAGFRSAQFDERTLFRSAEFRDEADFAVSLFKWIAFFDAAKFSADRGANFLAARFNGYTLFAKAQFRGIARFVSTQFSGPTVFSEATFSDQVLFTNGTRFEDSVTFRRAKFFRPHRIEDNNRSRAPVIFSGLVFSGEATFADSEFEHVDFGYTDWPAADLGIDTVFRQRADFRGARFRRLSLRQVSFQSEVDFSGAKLGDVVDLTDMDVGKASLCIYWPQLIDDNRNPKLKWERKLVLRDPTKEAEAEDARETNRRAKYAFYASLETAIKKAGLLDDAGEVHYFAEDLKRQDKSFAYGMTDLVLYKWIYGYGVRPSHQIITAVLLIGVFGITYSRRGVLRRDPSQPRSFRIRIADFPIDWSNSGSTFGRSTRFSPVHRALRALVFSFYVFFKVGFGGVLAARNYALLVTFEWFLGLILWILLLINLSNKWPLLHRLVTAVF